MHKFEEIYQNEPFIDNIEINLFEPKCIIIDTTKDENIILQFLQENLPIFNRKIVSFPAKNVKFSCKN